jgi:hypothetical protein
MDKKCVKAKHDIILRIVLVQPVVVVIVVVVVAVVSGKWRFFVAYIEMNVV